MTFCLNTKIIEPEDGLEIKNAIILLHGYGGDGQDISMLTYNWKRFMKNTIFLCPDGHQVCNISPTGFQWFDLSDEKPDQILENIKTAEKKLNQYISEVKKKYNLTNSKISLAGFSQGCMMCLNLGLTADECFNSVVGFSGKIINKKDLSLRIKSKPKILLIHGDLDEIVPSYNLLDAKDFLQRNQIDIETILIKNCDHHIPIDASSAALNFFKKNLL